MSLPDHVVAANLAAAAAERAFRRRFPDLREYRNSARNVAKLLRSARARGTHPDIPWILDRMKYGAHDGPFDHGRIFGARYLPMLIVGNPYQLNDLDHELLAAISDLDLHVAVEPKSLSCYGYGTIQVLVYSRNLPPRAPLEP